MIMFKMAAVRLAQRRICNTWQNGNHALHNKLTTGTLIKNGARGLATGHSSKDTIDQTRALKREDLQYLRDSNDWEDPIFGPHHIDGERDGMRWSNYLTKHQLDAMKTKWLRPTTRNSYQMALDYVLHCGEDDKTSDSAPRLLRDVLGKNMPDIADSPDWLYPTDPAAKVPVLETVVKAMKDDGFVPTLGTVHMLYQAYLEAGMIDQSNAARDIIKKLNPEDMLADSAALTWQIKSGEYDKAWKTFTGMRRSGLQPSLAAYVQLAIHGKDMVEVRGSGLGEGADGQKNAVSGSAAPMSTYVRMLLNSMAASPVLIPDTPEIFEHMIELCQSEVGSANFCTELFNEMETSPLLPNPRPTTYLAMFHVIGKCSTKNLARVLWEKMLEDNVFEAQTPPPVPLSTDLFASVMHCAVVDQDIALGDSCYLLLRRCTSWTYGPAQTYREIAYSLPPSFWEGFFKLKVYQMGNQGQFTRIYQEYTFFRQVANQQSAKPYDSLFQLAYANRSGATAIRLATDMIVSGLQSTPAQYRLLFDACRVTNYTILGKTAGQLQGVKLLVVENAVALLNSMSANEQARHFPSLLLAVLSSGQLPRGIQMLKTMEAKVGVKPSNTLITSLMPYIMAAPEKDKYFAEVFDVVKAYGIPLNADFNRTHAAALSDINLKLALDDYCNKDVNRQNPLAPAKPKN